VHPAHFGGISEFSAWFALAPLLALLLLGEAPPGEESSVEVWLGHQILRGMRHVPLHSDVLDETENYHPR